MFGVQRIELGREGRELQDVGWLEGLGSPEPPLIRISE